MIWHVVDARSIWVQEFAAALAQQVPVLQWIPEISWSAFLKNQDEEISRQSALRRKFPLQRGFARFPISWLVDEGRRMLRRLRRIDGDVKNCPLILCSPHYFALARAWPGPLVYYATDMFRFWGEKKDRIERMERIVCHAVQLVCPDSDRIAEYMNTELGVPGEKIVVLPMATRKNNLLPACPDMPGPIPPEIAGMSRPIAGVIGNLAANTDWQLLEAVVHRTPWLSWVFVGPTDMRVSETAQRNARTQLMRHGGRVSFVGYKPYGQLCHYARAFDVAILPYRKREPTYSGSSTRFYEHLAACRPMLATRGFKELLSKQPLVRLVSTPEEMVKQLELLRCNGFRDGYEGCRWQMSQSETWEARAAHMRQALSGRVSFGQAGPITNLERTIRVAGELRRMSSSN